MSGLPFIGSSGVRPLQACWRQILKALNETWLVPAALHMIDSILARAPHQAAGARGTPRQGFSRS